MEIDALLDGTDFPLVFSKAWFKELSMDHLRSSKGPVERCLCDGDSDRRSVQFRSNFHRAEADPRVWQWEGTQQTHQSVFGSSRAGCHFHRKGLFSSEGFG